MTEAEWHNSTSVLDMLGFLRNGSGRARLRARMSKHQCVQKLLIFSIGCCNRLSQLLVDPRSVAVLSAPAEMSDRQSESGYTDAIKSGSEDAYRVLRRGDNVPLYTAACAVMELARFSGKDSFSHAIYIADLAAQAKSYRQVYGVDECRHELDKAAYDSEKALQANSLRGLLGNPFRSSSVVE